MSGFEKWAELPHHHVVTLRRGNGGMQYLHALRLEDSSEIPEKSLDLPFLNRESSVVGASSCGGLLFFVEADSRLSIFNPTTKQLRTFEKSSSTTIALGYDSKSDDYKIVRVRRRPGTFESYAEVYSLKREQGWKERLPPPCIPNTPEYVYVAATGKSYWLAGDAVVAFDFSAEAFYSFDLPPLPYFCCPVAHVLVKLHDGLLGVVCYWRRGTDLSFDKENPGYYYELWVWREDESDWCRMFDVVCLCGGAGEPLGLIDGRLLLLQGISDSKEAESLILVYDWTTKECIEPHPRLYIYDCVVPVLSYVETSDELPQFQSLALALAQGEFIQSLPKEEEGTGEKLPRRIRIHGLTKDCRGEEGKFYEYEEIVDEQYTDWAINGFRVVDEYHPSETMYVLEVDEKPDMYSELVQIRERGCDDDYRYCSDEIPYIYIDQLKQLKVDDGDSQIKQSIEDDRKRKRADAVLPRPSSSRRSKDEKDQTSVYAYGIPSKTTPKDVLDLFSKAGKVMVATPITANHKSSKSEVVWHIVFYDAASVGRARALSGLPCFGQALVVLNYLFVSKSSAPSDVSVSEKSTNTILLQNLPRPISHFHLDELFDRFGLVKRILIPPKSSSDSVSVYVKFSSIHPGAAKQAQRFSKQLYWEGRIIEVSLVDDIDDADC